MENNQKNLSTTSLAMIIFIAVFGFSNIANNYQAVGTSAATMFIIGAILFFYPLSLIMAEFGAYAKDRTSGIYSWIEVGMGQKMAYIGVWAYFVANIFYLPALGMRVPPFLSYVLYGDSTMNNEMMAILAIITVLLAVVLGVKFEKGFDKISNAIGYLSLFVSIIFILAGIGIYLFGTPATTLTASSFAIDMSDTTKLSSVLQTFAWILFAFGGAEVCGTQIDKVDNPAKKFTKAILLSTIIISAFYILGILSLATFETAENFAGIELVNAVIDGYKFMGNKLGFGSWFFRFIALSYVLITIVALVLWSMSLTKAVFSEVPEGTFPNWLTKKNESGILTNALSFQSALVIVFILITNFGGDAAGEIYKKIYDMSTMAFLLPYVFLAISYITFRRNGIVAPFQAIKSNSGAIAIGYLVLGMLVVAFIFSGIDIASPLADQTETIQLYYGGLILFILIGILIKYLNNKNK